MKERRNISLDSRVHAMAQRIMEKQGHADFSGFVEELIRREHDLRFPPEYSFNDASPSYQATAKAGETPTVNSAGPAIVARHVARLSGNRPDNPPGDANRTGTGSTE